MRSGQSANDAACWISLYRPIKEAGEAGMNRLMMTGSTENQLSAEVFLNMNIRWH